MDARVAEVRTAQRFDRGGVERSVKKIRDSEGLRFFHRYANHLGKTVRELASETDAQDILEAKAFYGIEPYGCVADDHRAALVAFITAKVNYYKGRKPRFKDFLLEWGGKPEGKKRSGDELLASFKAFAAGLRKKPGD